MKIHALDLPRMPLPARAALAVAVALGSTALSCGGSQQPVNPFVEIPDRSTRATLAGPLCQENRCQCMNEGSPGLPERAGMKRYHFQLGPVENEMWVMVDSMVFYKSAEKASECFVVDLRTGEHEVVIRAQGEHGTAAHLQVAELGAEGAYRTFDFACGGPGSCAQSTLRDWHASLAKYKRGAHDPCGSTKIKKVKWTSDRAEDKVHPNDMQVDFVLDVYEFTPKHPPGDPACAEKF